MGVPHRRHTWDLRQKVQRVAPPGSLVAKAVADTGSILKTDHGGGPAEGAL